MRLTILRSCWAFSALGPKNRAARAFRLSASKAGWASFVLMVEGDATFDGEAGSDLDPKLRRGNHFSITDGWGSWSAAHVYAIYMDHLPGEAGRKDQFEANGEKLMQSCRQWS